jgi:hypothetical protein
MLISLRPCSPNDADGHRAWHTYSNAAVDKFDPCLIEIPVTASFPAII